MNIADKYERLSDQTIGESFNPPSPAGDSASEAPRAEVPPAPAAPAPKRHRGGLWAVAVLLVLILMALTCPSQEDHKQAVARAVTEYANREVVDADNPWSAFGSLLVNGIVNVFLDEVLTTDKYLVCSVGTIHYLDGGEERVSFGIFGHVFTFDADDLAERIGGLD